MTESVDNYKCLLITTITNAFQHVSTSMPTFFAEMTGAMGKSTGAQAPSAKEMILASGLAPNLAAASAVANTNAEAPSFSFEALAAVIVPSF